MERWVSGSLAGGPYSLDSSPWRQISHPTATQRNPRKLRVDSPYPKPYPRQLQWPEPLSHPQLERWMSGSPAGRPYPLGPRPWRHILCCTTNQWSPRDLGAASPQPQPPPTASVTTRVLALNTPREWVSGSLLDPTATNWALALPTRGASPGGRAAT